MLNSPLHVLNNLSRTPLVPGSVQVFGDGTKPEVMLELDSLAGRLAQIENERAKLHQQLEQILAGQDEREVERNLRRAAALDRYVQRSASQLRKRGGNFVRTNPISRGRLGTWISGWRRFALGTANCSLMPKISRCW